MDLKRYIIFAWDENPKGGMNDIVHTCDDRIAAIIYSKSNLFKSVNVQIFDRNKSKIIYETGPKKRD